MNQRPLQAALLFNAGFSLLSGLIFTFFSSQVADLIGISVPLAYTVTGVSLMCFAGFVAWTGTRRLTDTFSALLISMADFLWVIGTILLVVLTTASLTGALTLLVIAAIVGAFGVLQLRGIGKMYAAPDKPDAHRLCVAVETPVTADKLWSIIANLQNIHAYSPNLTEVILRENAQPGVDAVRQCTNMKGQTWGEHCTLFDPQQRQVAFEFLSDEPGFPYPFGTMIGGWDVIARDDGSTVNIWFEVTAKNRLLHSLILAVMARDLARSFGEVVTRMVAEAQGETIPARPTFKQYRISSQLAVC